MKPRILLVGDYNRDDFLYVAKFLHKEIDFYFIEHISQNYVTNSGCFRYGNVLFWKDFCDAYELLDQIRPDKVVFYFIESYCHVALNVACGVKSVPTFHLEHGVRYPLVHYEMILQSKPPIKRPAGFYGTRLREFFDRYKSRRFFRHTQKNSPDSERAFLRQYFGVRSRHSIHETYKKLKSKYRLADTYISFSPEIFNFHKELEDLPDDYPVKHIGIPMFDKFFAWRHLLDSGENILLIDQPLWELGLFGWTKTYRAFFLENLQQIALSMNKKLHIKPHPLNDLSLYEPIKKAGDVQIMEAEDWESVVPDINTVLGISSTLLMPFLGMDHVCCFTMEMQPAQVEFQGSQFYVKSGVCDPVISFDELRQKMNKRRTWHQKQQASKEHFIHKWMYRFDGNCSKRLKEILLA